MWSLSLILGTAYLFFSPTHCSDLNQPNIVFILADDLGYNDIGYHNLRIRTPNLDSLCSRGVRLENYYVQPICTPTRSQLMSGRYQIHTGLQHGVIFPYLPVGLPLDSPTLADKLSEAGYSTYAVGKWHLGFWKKEYLPTNRGFDRFFGFYMGALDHYQHNRCLQGRCGVDLHDDTPTSFTNVRNESGSYSTYLYTQRAVNWISAHDTGKPLFMYLAYQAPHGPLQVPHKHMKQYTNIRDWKRSTFSGMMTALDEGVGEVVSALKRKGLWNNTILVFSTDNGADPKKGGSNSPLRGTKGSWFEGGIRGVGFVASPLLKRKGYTSNALIHVSDWFPTFINLANGTMNGTRDIAGVDQWDTISRDAQSRRTEILHGIDPISRAEALSPVEGNSTFDARISAAIRVGDYKLITGPKIKKGKISGSIRTATKKSGNKKGKGGSKRKPGKKPARGGRRKKFGKKVGKGKTNKKFGKKGSKNKGAKRKPRKQRGKSGPRRKSQGFGKQGKGGKVHTSSRSAGQPSRISRSAGEFYRMPRSLRRTTSRHTSGSVSGTPTQNGNLVRLYNIRNDPLEQFDLSKREPEMVQELLNKLQEYYETSVPALDPKAHRIRPVDGFWGPQL